MNLPSVPIPLVMNLTIYAVFALAWISLALYQRFKKNKSTSHLIIFTVFYWYLFKVIDYTLIQFQSLVVLKRLLPSLMLHGQEYGKDLNLVPLLQLRIEDIKTSLLNILLFIPFGIMLPYFIKSTGKRIICIGALLSLIIELLQYTTGKLAHMTFRIADINDIIFNTIGTAIGYLLFITITNHARSLLKTEKAA